MPCYILVKQLRKTSIYQSIKTMNYDHTRKNNDRHSYNNNRFAKTDLLALPNSKS